MEETVMNDRAAAPMGETSPFATPPRRYDRWLNWGIAAAAVAVLGVLLFLGVTYYQDAHRADTESPSARAVSNLRKMVTASPNNAMARVRLAEAMMANGQESEAIAQLGEALKIDKELTPALTDLGLIAMDRREWTKAEEYWGTIIGLLKRDPMSGQDQRLSEAYYYLGTTLVELKRNEEAVANLKESVRIKRDSAPVHYMLSVAYQRLGLPEQQKRELDIVVAFDPENAQANYDLGLLLLKAGDKAGAAELFRVAADHAPAGITDPQKQLDALGEAGRAPCGGASLQGQRSEEGACGGADRRRDRSGQSRRRAPDRATVGEDRETRSARRTRGSGSSSWFPGTRRPPTRSRG